MEVPQIIGADISKKNIDFACSLTKKNLRISNDEDGFKTLSTWITEQGIDRSRLRVVMEHTGGYSYRFEQFLQSKSLPFVKVSALAIKRSMGLVRGKTDKQDAKRICRYGMDKADQLMLAQPVAQGLQRLQMLYSIRERFVRDRASMKTAVKEMQGAFGLKDTDSLIATQLKMVKSFDQQIENLEAQISDIVKADKNMDQNYQLVQTIKGVGKVLALATIVKTQNFTRFTDARKFACFCGTAPFENTSGTSIKGRTRVSHLADKGMKTLLDLAAKSAIRYDAELKQYYCRRTAAGKPKMSTINVVRNKLLYRIFAVVKRQTPFEPLPIAA
jgi:transposase